MTSNRNWKKGGREYGARIKSLKLYIYERFSSMKSKKISHNIKLKNTHTHTLSWNRQFHTSTPAILSSTCGKHATRKYIFTVCGERLRDFRMRTWDNSSSPRRVNYYKRGQINKFTNFVGFYHHWKKAQILELLGKSRWCLDW